MDKYEIAIKLMRCFPHSFINGRGEFIAHQKSNTYLIFNTCETLEDVQCKVIEWLSRAAYKTEPYRSKQSNSDFHSFMLTGINQFLGTKFKNEDMEIIYTYLGNACNHDLTVQFVKSGFDMEVIWVHVWKNMHPYSNIKTVLERIGAKAHGEG